MSENIGKLTTPNNDGASIEVGNLAIKTNNPIEFNNRGRIIYSQNRKWFVFQNIINNNVDQGPFILLNDGDSVDISSTKSYKNGAITICARTTSDTNKSTISLTNTHEFGNLTLSYTELNKSVITYIDSIIARSRYYIQYNSGLLICHSPVIGGDAVVTYPIPFIKIPSLAFGYMANDVVNARMGYAINYSNTGFTCKIRNIIGSDLVTQSDVSYIAIGRWK